MAKTKQRPSQGERFQIERVLSEALTPMHLHNHLNSAYHEAGLYHLAPPWGLMWWIPVAMVPRKVRVQVDAVQQVELVRQRIAAARTSLERFRPLIDDEFKTLVNCDTVPYRNLHPGITGGKNDPKPGYMTSWSYALNPYQLATTVLDEYEQFIDQTMSRRLTPFTQLSRIWRKAESNAGNLSLIASAV